MKNKIAVIGVGGRTGAMFAFELKEAADVLGVGKEREVEIIRERKFYIKREGSPPKLLEVKTIRDFEFPGQFLPDLIFLTTKNPVGPAIEYYYSLFQNLKNSEIKTGQKIKFQKKLPALILSQNGLAAGDDAKNALEKILDKRANEVQIIRVSLFTAVERRDLEGKIYINYSLPIRLCLSVFSGPREVNEIALLFREAGIVAEEISSEKVRDMEFSKLFVNLIGMASATKGLSLKDGFNDRETFKEEVISLKEYIKVVKAAGGNLLNLSQYPIKLFTPLLEKMPLSILILSRKKIGGIINQGRAGKEKGNLDEIDYYTGEVVRLGKQLGIKTPINEKILKRAKEKM